MGFICCLKARLCFDKPVLSRVEGLSTNGVLHPETLFPFALSLSKGAVS
jgi:hypothetical protein